MHFKSLILQPQTEDDGNIFLNSSVYPSPYAVNKQTLTLLSIFFICSYNSKPFISGILISRIRRSYFLLLLSSKEDSANRGSINVSTSNPPSSKPIVNIEALSGSSSTTKIFLFFSLLIFGYLSFFLK